MKLNKNALFISSIILSLGAFAVSCGDDSSDDNACPVYQQKDDSGNCVDKTCDAGKTLNKATGECDPASKNCEIYQEKDASGNCVDKTCEAGKTLNKATGECDPASVTPDTCGNKQIDADEICDRDANGDILMPAGTTYTCSDLNQEGGITYLDEAGTKPGCSDKCTLSKGTCKSTCGNGQLDANEVCEMVNGELVVPDNTEIACTLWKPGDYADGGKPKCAADCRSFARGTCELKGEETGINGIVSCKAELTVDGSKVSGTATVESAQDKAVSGKIVCGLKGSKVVTALTGENAAGTKADKVYTVTGEYDLNNLSSGTYGCHFYVQAEGQEGGVICSSDGEVSKTNGTFDETSTEAVVAAAVDADVFASWTSFSRDDSDKVAADGMPSNDKEGTDQSVLLKFVGMAGVNITVKTTTNSSSVLAALQLNTNSKAVWGSEAKQDKSSHLLIASTEGYSDIVMNMTADSRNNKIIITAVTDTAETEVKTLDSIGKDNKYTESGDIAIGSAKEIRIYPIDASSTSMSAFNLEKLTLKGKKN